MFNYRGNGNDFFINEPLLEPLSGALFVFGVAGAAARIVGAGRSPRRAAGATDLPLAPRRRGAPACSSSSASRWRCCPACCRSRTATAASRALPFVVPDHRGSARTALADAVRRPLPADARRAGAAAAVLAVLVVVVAGGRDLPRVSRVPAPRRSTASRPTATAGGEYLRRFGERLHALRDRRGLARVHARLPLVQRRRHAAREPLRARAAAGGHRGAHQPLRPQGAGVRHRSQARRPRRRSSACSACSPSTASSRSPPPRLGGAQVGDGADRRAADTARAAGCGPNTTRALAVGGDERGGGGALLRAGRRCARRLAASAADAPAAATAKRRWRGCALLADVPAASAPRCCGGVSAPAVSRCAPTSVADGWRPSATLEAGRWYEVDAALHPDGSVARERRRPRRGATEPLVRDGAAPAAHRRHRAARAGRRRRRSSTTSRSCPASRRPATRAGRRRAGDGLGRRVRRGLRGDAVRAARRRAATGGASPDRSRRSPVRPAPASRGGAADRRPAMRSTAGTARRRGSSTSRSASRSMPAAILRRRQEQPPHREVRARRRRSCAPWGQHGERPGEFREPHDVAADAEFVYVADTWNQRVQVFDPNGAHVFTITGAPSLSSPRGVFAKDQLIYIAEAGAGRVTVYDRAGKLRQTDRHAGRRRARAISIEPVDVAVDPQRRRVGGELRQQPPRALRRRRHAARRDPGSRLDRRAPQGGRIWRSMPTGRSISSDWDRGAVRRFRPDGSELTPLGSQIRQPAGVAVQRDRILVVARGRRCRPRAAAARTSVMEIFTRRHRERS